MTHGFGDCGRNDCFPCTSGDIGKCHRTNINYKIECIECDQNGPTSYPKSQENGVEIIPITDNDRMAPRGSQKAIYWGESSRNAYTRGSEHLEAIDSEDTGNAMWKHCIQYHEGHKVNFKMKTIGTFKDPLTRLVSEGVNIVAGNQDILLNSKAEFRQGVVGQTRTRSMFAY